MSDLVADTLKAIKEGNTDLTREAMETPGGYGEGKMKADKPCDIGTAKGKSKQPDETGQTGQTKPNKVKDITPK